MELHALLTAVLGPPGRGSQASARGGLAHGLPRVSSLRPAQAQPPGWHVPQKPRSDGTEPVSALLKVQSRVQTENPELSCPALSRWKSHQEADSDVLRPICPHQVHEPEPLRRLPRGFPQPREDPWLMPAGKARPGGDEVTSGDRSPDLRSWTQTACDFESLKGPKKTTGGPVFLVPHLLNEEQGGEG